MTWLGEDLELRKSQRWSQGPRFLQHPNYWPSLSELAAPDDRDELKNNHSVEKSQPDIANIKSWKEMLKATHSPFAGRLLSWLQQMP